MPAPASPTPQPARQATPQATKRYAPGLPMPLRAFLPGTGMPRPHAPSTGAAAHDDGLALRYGADLFNHGFWWEAHEAWEAPWHALRAQHPALAMLLRGCIMITAGHLKGCLAQPRGRTRLYARALAQWQAAEDTLATTPPAAAWPVWLPLRPQTLLAQHGPWLRTQIASPTPCERDALLHGMPRMLLNR